MTTDIHKDFLDHIIENINSERLKLWREYSPPEHEYEMTFNGHIFHMQRDSSGDMRFEDESCVSTIKGWFLKECSEVNDDN
jgi:hypothetical protein